MNPNCKSKNPCKRSRALYNQSPADSLSVEMENKMTEKQWREKMGETEIESLVLNESSMNVEPDYNSEPTLISRLNSLEHSMATILKNQEELKLLLAQKPNVIDENLNSPKKQPKRIWGRCNQGENKGKFFTYLEEDGVKVENSWRMTDWVPPHKKIDFTKKDGSKFKVLVTLDGEHHIKGTYEPL